MRIPQCSPHASYLVQREQIDQAVRSVLEGGRYILGPEVVAFEAEFASFTGAAAALGVANGTDALEIALRIAGVGPGDIVLTVSHSAVATAVAIRATGADPLFVDVDPDFGLMDPDRLAETLDSATKGLLGVDPRRIRAILPVHLYGRCANMRRICTHAAEAGIAVVEDCAQAHGASIEGKHAGSWGASASFSFYPTKNLGGFGDGGAVSSTDAELIERARLLREYGWRTRYISDVEGGNSRLDEIQAAILRVKLRRLNQANARRRQIAKIYLAGLRNPFIVLPPVADTQSHVYHQFTVRAEARDSLQDWLGLAGIGSLVHYPRAIHQQPAYSSGSYAPLPLPVTESWARNVLSLPMFPEMLDEEVAEVIERVNAWMPRES